MFSVGLDEFENLILYAQLIAAKIVNNKPIIYPDPWNSLGRPGESVCFYSDFNNNKDAGQHSRVGRRRSWDARDARFATPPLLAGEEVKEIIFGSLLGDAKIEMPPRCLNARFGFTQSLDKKEYFLSVLNSLDEICSGKYREMSYLDQRTGKTYANLNFWSKSLPLLNEFYFSFYSDLCISNVHSPGQKSRQGAKGKKKVKIVPVDLSLLTPLALAHWVMQDGAIGSSKGLYLCTDSFTHVEVTRLSQYLINTYDIKCSIHKAGKNYRIYILVQSLEKIKFIILPFMHKTMTYKLGV
jgi:hypothetical protein